MDFDMHLAGLNVSVKNCSEYVKRYCKDYICEFEKPDIVASASEEEIEQELALFEDAIRQNAEIICVYRSIARQLPRFSKFVFHGAAITYNDDAFLFTAPSGTGKTTHITLWKKYLKEKVGIVNGDKPIIGVEDDITVYGTPWAGKEGLQNNRSATLKGICILKRGTDNKVERLTAAQSVDFIMKQIYLPDVPDTLGKTMVLLDVMLKKLPIYVASIDMSEDAVKATFEALTNQKYGE